MINRRLKKIGLATITSTLLCVLVIGCMRDEFPLRNPQQGDGIEFQLNIPTSTQVETRGTTDASAAELTIKQAYCLIYANNSPASKPQMAYTFNIAKDIATGTNGTAAPMITVPKK